MSVEQMIEGAIKASVQEAEAAVARVEQRKAFLQSMTADLAEVYNKLIAAEDEGDIEELEEEAADLAEILEIEFVYVRTDGKTRRYSPEAFWEPSGGCEWVESAQYGSDYGWDIY